MSECVCRSMKPGETTRPRASIVRAAAAFDTRPTAAMRPFRIATSPANHGLPEPSTICPTLPESGAPQGSSLAARLIRAASDKSVSPGLVLSPPVAPPSEKAGNLRDRLRHKSCSAFARARIIDALRASAVQSPQELLPLRHRDSERLRSAAPQSGACRPATVPQRAQTARWGPRLGPAAERIGVHSAGSALAVPRLVISQRAKAFSASLWLTSLCSRLTPCLRE